MKVRFVHERSFGTPVKQKRVPVSLLHLPDELLLQVIDELQLNERDLYALSIQCKRLQRLSLPLYLLRLGVTIPLIFPIHRLVITPQHLSVPGFSLAFFAKNVRRLSCDISPVQSPALTLLALQRLSGMIINIKGLVDLALHFKHWKFTPWIDLDPTTQACKHLLEVVAERCTSLTLSHTSEEGLTSLLVDLVGKEAIQWSGCPPLIGPFKAVRRRLSLGFSPSRVSETYPHRSYTLKTLIFQSNGFLLPPFYGWAFRILNTAPLTRLDLIDVELHPDISSCIFWALTIPNLEYLRIVSCRIDFDPLAEFLSRHNAISTFDLISDDVIPNNLPRGTLPRLTSLKSNAHTIVHLLTGPSAFPKLAHVCAVAHLPSIDDFIFDNLENPLARVAKRLTEMNIRLCLVVLTPSHTACFVDWANLPNDLRDYPVLSNVREIAFGFPHPDRIVTTSILTWLSVFPLLEHVEFLDT